MNCPNCGRELAEGEVCNCTQQSAPTPQQPPQETYYTPPVAAYVPQQNQQNQQGQYYAPQQPAVTEVPARTDYPEGYKIKKKLVAVILASTVGMFGIHNYYLGNNSRALAQLLVCLLGSLVFGLGAIVAYVWAIVEAILIFAEKSDKDANGYKIMTFEESIAKAINEGK